MNKHSFNKLIIIYSDFLLLLYNKILLLPFYINIFIIDYTLYIEKIILNLFINLSFIIIKMKKLLILN